MKIIKGLIIIICVFAMSSANSQNQTQKQKENKIQIFTMEEFSNFHVWLHGQVKEMKMSDEVQLEYDTLFGLYAGRIGRIEDEEKALTEEGYIKNMKAQINKLNSSVKPILSSDQNKKHLDIMTDFEKVITNKLLKKE